MSEKPKRKHKAKRKRGYNPYTIDFVTPLFVDECIEQLRAGRSPLKRWQKAVGGDNRCLRVVATWGWGGGIRVSLDLSPRPDGLTHISGQIESNFRLWRRMLMFLLIFMIVMPGISLSILAVFNHRVPLVVVIKAAVALVPLFAGVLVMSMMDEPEPDTQIKTVREWIVQRLDG